MPRQTKAEDERLMHEAVSLAARGRGRTSPNPPVGAILVKHGRVIGTGWHRKAGANHAEVAAIASAGKASRGAKLYVTLEPCSTQGRTGACTEAILAAGITSVTVGSVDPNPRHRGRGISILRRAGVQVRQGVLSEATDGLIAPFTKWITTGLPYITVKMAMSVDGRTADRRGRSKWISCPESRRNVKLFRGQVDAVMVGAGTARADNPSLNPVASRGYQPYRVVVASNGRLNPSSNLISDKYSKRTIVLTGRSCEEAVERKLGRHGAKVVGVRETGGRLSLKDAARKLANMGILHVFCEGGASIAASLFRSKLVDCLQVYSAPFLLGDSGCTPVIAGDSWTLINAPRMILADSRRIGSDLFAEYRMEEN